MSTALLKGQKVKASLQKVGRCEANKKGTYIEGYSKDQQRD